MKSLYKILFLGTCATNILAASASLEPTTASAASIAAAGAGHPSPYYTSVTTLASGTYGSWRDKYTVGNHEVFMIDGQKIVVDGAFRPRNPDISALRESLYRLNKQEKAFPSHPQTLAQMTLALMTLPDTDTDTIARIPQLINSFVPLTSLSFEEKHAVMNAFLSKPFLAPGVTAINIQQALDFLSHLIVTITSPAEKAAAQSHAVGLNLLATELEKAAQDKADSAAACYATGDESDEDTVKHAEYMRESNKLFLEALSIHKKAAHLGNDASYARLQDLLHDDSTILNKTHGVFLYGKYIPSRKSVKRVNSKDIHRELGLATLRRADGTLAKALDHLNNAYEGKFKVTAEHALTNIMELTPGCDMEQIILELLNRGYAPVRHKALEEYKAALVEPLAPASRTTRLQHLMLSYINVLKANGKDWTKNTFVQAILNQTQQDLATTPHYGTTLKWLGDIYHLMGKDVLAYHNYGMAYSTAGNTDAYNSMKRLNADSARVAEALSYIKTVSTMSHYNPGHAFNTLATFANKNPLLGYTLQKQFIEHIVESTAEEILKLSMPRINNILPAMELIHSFGGNLVQAQKDTLFSKTFWLNNAQKEALYRALAPENNLLTEANYEEIRTRLLETLTGINASLDAALAPLEAQFKEDAAYREIVQKEVRSLIPFFRPEGVLLRPSAKNLLRKKAPALPTWMSNAINSLSA